MTEPKTPLDKTLDDLNLTLAHLLPAMRGLLSTLEDGNQEAGAVLGEMMQMLTAIDRGLTALLTRPGAQQDLSQILPRLDAIEQRLAARETQDTHLIGAVERLTALLTAPA